MLYWSGITGWARNKGARDNLVRVLAYHSVDDSPEYCSASINVTPALFDRQMGYVSKNYNVITLDDVAAFSEGKQTLPERAVVITFDDGYRNNLKFAAPILEKHGLVAHFFVISDVVLGKAPFWVSSIQRLLVNAERVQDFVADFGLDVSDNCLGCRQNVIDAFMTMVNQKDGGLSSNLVADAFLFFGKSLKDEIGADYMLDETDLVSLDRMGMHIGSHSVDHPILTRISRDRQRFQLEHSKEALQTILQKPVEHIAFPNGPGVEANCDNSTADLACDLGYRTASTSIRGVVRESTRIHLLPRHNIDTDLGLRPFAFKLEEHRFMAV